MLGLLLPQRMDWIRCPEHRSLFFPFGLTQKYSKKEWNHWRVVCSSHLGKDDLGSGTRTDYSYGGFLLSVAKSRFMRK